MVLLPVTALSKTSMPSISCNTQNHIVKRLMTGRHSSKQSEKCHMPAVRVNLWQAPQEWAFHQLSLPSKSHSIAVYSLQEPRAGKKMLKLFSSTA